MTLRVFLGGEGANELGSFAREPSYQSGNEFPGVVQALLERGGTPCWQIAGALPWKRIRKFRAKGPTPAEEQNVRGLVIEASRAGAHVVAFVRDEDGDSQRTTVIERVLHELKEEREQAAEAPSPHVIGGTCVPTLEGWILALLGETRVDELSKVGVQRRLEEKGIASKDTAAMVGVVRDANWSAKSRSKSLERWLERARVPQDVDRTPGSV